MHEHSHIMSMVLVSTFAISNVVIAAGYIAVPFLVLRYLPLTRAVQAWGLVLFGGCAITHLGMALLIHSDVGVFWTIEHAVQAVGTWGFIIAFHRMLRAADARRPRRSTVGGGDEQ